MLDDAPQSTAAVARALRLQGFQVLAANCAAEAFELLARHRVGVVPISA